MIQKYLRNQYKTIEEYNARGRRGGRAVPRAGGRELPGELHARGRQAAGQHRQQRPVVRRLHARQRATRKPPCRATSAWPTSERRAVHLAWKDGAFVCEGPGAGPVPADARTARPTRRRSPRLVQQVGEASRDAARVEVPFEYIAPKPGEVWTGDARQGLRRCRSAGPGRRKRQSFAARPRDRAARPGRRQDRLRQIDAAARPHHEPGADLLARTRSSCT